MKHKSVLGTLLLIANLIKAQNGACSNNPGITTEYDGFQGPSNYIWYAKFSSNSTLGITSPITEDLSLNDV